MIYTVIILAVALYLIELTYLKIGLAMADKHTERTGYEPTVSIIVAARDEEQFIGECIDSLLKLDYPVEKLEIIIVNDGSTDRTNDIIESYIRKGAHITGISTTPGTGNLRGKTNALAQGIDRSTGEILMFTDADCRVSESWVRETVKSFHEDTGIVGGFTVLDSGSIFEGMQAVDWIFLFSLASSNVGWKYPLTLTGNNLSVRRRTYDQTGGYGSIPFSVTEDFSLVRAVINRTAYKIAFPIKEGAIIRSHACGSWRQVYRQKQRWAVGGLTMVPYGYMIMAIGYIAKLLLLIGLFTVNIVPILLLTAVMFAFEFALIWRPMKKLRILKYYRYFIPFAFYLCLYALSLPFVALFGRKIIWKERRLS